MNFRSSTSFSSGRKCCYYSELKQNPFNADVLDHLAALGIHISTYVKANKFQCEVHFTEEKNILDVFEAIKTRRSIRRYLQEPIPDDKLEMIFEAARLAPSAGNHQPWRFVVVQDANRKKALTAAPNSQTFLRDAAAVVAAVGDPEASARWHEKDPMIALEHMALAAAALGYGTCWIGAFDEDVVKHLLKISAKMRIVAMMPIGLPNETPAPRPRKELSEIFFKEEWQTPWHV